jgi:hypothetical protein
LNPLLRRIITTAFHFLIIKLYQSWLIFTFKALIEQVHMQMFVVGPNFKGVKMMPPGPHFIYYSAASRWVLCTSYFSFEYTAAYMTCEQELVYGIHLLQQASSKSWILV